MSRFDPGKPWNGHAAAYTFTTDDGYDYNLNWRDEMVQHGRRYTAFVNSGTINGSLRLTLSELRELSDNGVEIGGHSQDHLHLPVESEASLDVQVLDDHAQLEDWLQKPVRGFAYPYHEHGHRELRKVAEVYEYARNGATGGVNLLGPGEPHEWALLRDWLGRYSIPMRTQSSELVGAGSSFSEAQTRAAVQTKAAYWIEHSLWEIHLAHIQSECDTTHLGWILEELAGLDVWIAPMGEIVRYIDTFRRRISV